MAFPAWAARLGPDHRLDLSAFGAIGDTALTTERAFEMTARGLGRLVGGMCETDFSGYPDCRRDTLDALQTALNLGMDRKFVIDTPLMRLTKAQTWALTLGLGGPALVDIVLEDTHTCYAGERGAWHDWGHGCGVCPACELRARGWREWEAAGRPALAA
jgi:7-cyano-7-deazaguanine synthase